MTTKSFAELRNNVMAEWSDDTQKVYDSASLYFEEISRQQMESGA